MNKQNKLDIVAGFDTWEMMSPDGPLTVVEYDYLLDLARDYDSQSRIIKEKDQRIEELEEKVRSLDMQIYKESLAEHELDTKEDEIERLREALVTISKGCPTKTKGCTCLENTAMIALANKVD